MATRIITLPMIHEKIQSVRQAVGKEYNRPDPEKVDKFMSNLEDSVDAQDYLKVERGLTEETIKHFKLGYDPERDAISIPIYKNDELINIKYRFLNPQKMRYSSERGAETWIYNEDGIEQAKKKGGVLVVEGEFDLMSVWQSGIDNVVSTASGKDSYGVWLTLLDRIPKVYLAFDNDTGGRQSGRKFAERVGLDKSFEVRLPEGIKDASEYFQKHNKDEFRVLLTNSVPYYSYEFKSLSNVIKDILDSDSSEIEIPWMPRVQIEKDWLMVISGKTNVGKTSYCMNVADDLAKKGIPTLIMPFERGISSVGRRYLQVSFNKTVEDFQFTSKDDWDGMIEEVVDRPIYFTLPKKNEIKDTVRKSKRFFDTRVVIIDHLDYVIRHTSGNREAEIANSLQEFKLLGEELGVIFMIVTHVRKVDDPSGKGRKPSIEDLKGSSSLYQDPEAVILLTSDEADTITVHVAKNKGPMGEYTFGIKSETGRMNLDPNDF